MVWAANGLPLDLLRMVPGLMPSGVDWPRLATKTLALAAAVVLARLALTRPDASASTRAARWYGYAAFVLALPYPALRTWWALGGTLGLGWPGAAGQEVAEVGLEALEAARHDEADGDVGFLGLGQLSAQVGEEGVVLASRDEAGGCCWAGGEVVALARGDVAGAAAGSGTSPR